MNLFGGNSPWGSSPFAKGRALGQVPLVLGPSSWGAGSFPTGNLAPAGQGPYWGEWGVVDESGRDVDGGRVGPFNTIQEAFDAATKEAQDHGAELLPTQGFAQVRDSYGSPVGPVT